MLSIYEQMNQINDDESLNNECDTECYKRSNNHSNEVSTVNIPSRVNNEQLNEGVKVEPIINEIVSIIENSRFTTRSISSTDSTITMEDPDKDKTTYTVKVKYVPEFILEEELAGVILKTTNKREFINDSAVMILKK